MKSTKEVRKTIGSHLNRLSDIAEYSKGYENFKALRKFEIQS